MNKPYVIDCKQCKKTFSWKTRYKKYCPKCNPCKKKVKRKKYSIEFQRAKEYIRLRDRHICQECGKNVNHIDVTKRSAPVHHIDGNEKNNDTKNLVTLCIGCHLLIHRVGLKKFNVNRIKIPKDIVYVKKKKKLLFKGI